MTLVVGSTGLVGSEVCRLLREKGKPVRALVRQGSNPDKVRKLTDLGCEITTGDLKDKQSLVLAVRGAAAVISTASSTVSRQSGDSLEAVDRDGQLALIDAARGAGVARYLFLSFVSNPQIRFPLSDYKQAVERHLKESGLSWTILPATNFMEIWLNPVHGFDYVNGSVRVLGSGDAKTNWVSYLDVAAIMAEALDHREAGRATIGIGGPEALSYHDVIRIFEEESGRKFEAEYVPEKAQQQGLEHAPDSMQKSFAGLGLNTARGYQIDMTETQRLFPRKLRSVRDYARQALGKG